MIFVEQLDASNPGKKTKTPFCELRVFFLFVLTGLLTVVVVDMSPMYIRNQCCSVNPLNLVNDARDGPPNVAFVVDGGYLQLVATTALSPQDVLRVVYRYDTDGGINNDSVGLFSHVRIFSHTHTHTTPLVGR
jgi:hypothetical protein